MDSKKSERQHYTLRGATRILSENPVEEPNKEQLAADKTTNSTAFIFDDSSATSMSNNVGQSLGQAANMPLYGPVTDAVIRNPTSATASTSTSTNSSTTSNSYGLAQPPPLASTMTQTSASNNHHQQQQHMFRSPQFMPDIRSLFECPICFDYAVPPIYQCQNGHLVCQGCSQKITHCPTCRVPVAKPSIRNLQLDRLANTFQFPCKYDFNGCPWKSYCYEKREHEERCEFISYSCPCPGSACKWTGLLSQVMPHLNEHHKSITTLSGEDIVFLATDINLKGAVDWVMIQSCFNHHFLLVLEKQELKNGQQQFFAVVQLIGSQKEADKFRYKLELSNNHSGQGTKRLQWDATPRSILEGIQRAISTYDCLVFDARMAQHFLSPIQKDKVSAGQAESPGENLGINVTIDRVL